MSIQFSGFVTSIAIIFANFNRRNVKVRIDKDEDDENPEIPPRRMARTPSLDSRGRLRRDRESRSSSNSPVRCQSAFTRDGVGRRSVSEKRHAHMNAADFPILNKNAFVHRSIADEQGNELTIGPMPWDLLDKPKIMWK